MIEVIYACGDSHTAGGETVDDMLWPAEHPGFRDIDAADPVDPRTISKWRSFRKRMLDAGSPVGWEEWQVLEKGNAWPAALSEMTGVRVINDALIGSSMEWVARQTLDGVSRLLEEHRPENVLAIVSPGAWPRIQHYISAEQRWGSMQLASADGIDRHVHEWFVLNEDDASLLTRWLVSITGMSAVLGSLGVRLLLLDPDATNMSHELGRHPELSHLVETYGRVCGGLWHRRSMLDIARGVDLPRCPDLHWRREVHRLVAEDLSALL